MPEGRDGSGGSKGKDLEFGRWGYGERGTGGSINGNFGLRWGGGNILKEQKTTNNEAGKTR